MKDIKELLIVGIPRSGSTLTAALVDSLENSLCLSEPEKLFSTSSFNSKNDYVDSVIDLLTKVRQKVRDGEAILDRRNPDGTPTTNYVKNIVSGDRVFQPEKHLVRTSEYDAETMLVAIKHNVPFLSVLSELVATGVPIVGVVRNPVPTILSWHETKLPVASGFMPSAEKFWKEINMIFDQSENSEAGWASIYDAFCVRLLSAGVPIIKYENIIDDNEYIEELLGRKAISKVDIYKKDWGQYSGAEKYEKIINAIRKFAPNALSLYPELQR